MSSFKTTLTQQLDTTTLLSLSAVLAILTTAYALSTALLSPTTPKALRVLFIWHFFDFLIHTIFEGSFLWNCFFVSTPATPEVLASTPSILQNGFLGFSGLFPGAAGNAPGSGWGDSGGRLYGPAYGDDWSSKLWMVYAKADHRWAGADLTVVSLELLTVFLAGPLALYICVGIWRRWEMVGFWVVVLATGELYGGFMTFCPEWLTGNPNLDTSNFMFLWVYLVFFNVLWVFMPLYGLWWSFGDVRDAVLVRRGVLRERERKGRETKKGR